MRSEYLLFNLLIIGLSSLFPIAYSKAIWPRFRVAIRAILCISIPYLVWDILVTNLWWEFNENYVIGKYFLSLPIEEVMFFVTVPWSCLVIWVNLPIRLGGKVKLRVESLVLILGFFVMLGTILVGWWYSFVVGGLLVLLAGVSIVNNNWLSSLKSLVFVLVTCLLIAVFNGYLTSRPVVIYSEQFLSNLRLGTVPIEDYIYGVVLVSMMAMAYDFFEKRLKD